MPIYLVSPLAHNADKIAACVTAKIGPEDRYEIQGRAGWFVSYKGTSVELSHLLGITKQGGGKVENGPGPALVLNVGSYYGLGATPMWEWLKTRFEGSP